MIKNFKPRLYQETILATAAEKNTLVVLPTGMGKTNIFLMLSAQRLKNYPNSKILLIGPTRPLIDQYYNVFKENFEIKEEEMAVFTGMVKPETREELWKQAKVIFSTPQGLENDIISGKIKLEEVSLLGVDEAHRAVGDYAYVFIAKQYWKKAKYPRILALTASPGSDVEKISEVCKNLYIEDVEIRTEDDPDVRPYIKETEVEWVKIDLPESFLQVRIYLYDCLKSKINEIKKYGFARNVYAEMSKKDLLLLQSQLQSEIARGNKDYQLLKSISLLAETMKVYHALELLEGQGISALNKYLEKLFLEAKTTKVKAVQNLVSDINFKSALVMVRNMNEAGVEHPKMFELKRIVESEIVKNKDAKIMVFTQYRDSASKIIEVIGEINGVRANIFVGQMKKGDTGLTQKKQIEVLDKFREGIYNVLVATSVAEEGLDIPRVDLVVFYEPIPSAIRTIQRKGRTGRQEKGRVIVLMAKKTRDEAYRWSAFHKEKRMYRIIKDLKGKIGLELGRKQQKLTEFDGDGDKIRIFADYREKGSGVIKELIEIGVDIKLDKLNIGDYILSGRACVEYKTTKDFVDSLIDGRLMEQVRSLKQNFERPVIIVEGSEDIYSLRKVHPNAIRGMLATIAVSYGVPVLSTKNFKESAALLAIIAKREQEETSKEFNPHGSRKPLTLKEQQEYVVSSLPSVGPALAKELLKNFKTVKSVLNADEGSLKKTEGLGEITAKRIKDVVEGEYK